MILGIHHAQITVPKDAEAEARDFYCRVLELPEVPKPDALKPRGGFWLRVGSQNVHVGVEDGVERARTKAHLAYEVSDLNHWRAKLESLGVEVIEAIPVPGQDRFEFRDPFGNRVEMLRPASPPTRHP